MTAKKFSPKIPEHRLRRMRIRVCTKQSVAISQLETAISLWLDNGDIASIHTLAIAASDCFHAMSKTKGKPSPFQNWIKSQSKAFQDQALEAQNFLKHGHKNLKGEISISPLYGEIMMYDSVACHEMAIGPMSPLMRAFATLFVIENREILDERFIQITEGLDVDYLAKIGRREAANQLLELFAVIEARLPQIPSHLVNLLKKP